MNFEGDIDFTKELPVFNFNSSIRKIDLTALNLLKRKNAASLSADLSISLVGSNIDNAQGFIEARDLVYTEGGKVVKADLVNLESKLGEWRELSITSDFVDAKYLESIVFNFASNNPTFYCNLFTRIA
ncbi:MAG: hypothetical protein IPO63_14990 [Bacteroidetes bacterium]|nr:hypothetical protein [Bacteroidota bacterium]